MTSAQGQIQKMSPLPMSVSVVPLLVVMSRFAATDGVSEAAKRSTVLSLVCAEWLDNLQKIEL